MSASEIFLQIVVALAAMLQGVTGIGFALLAAPALLMVRGEAASLQVISLLTVVIAALLLPAIWRSVDRRIFVPVTLAAVAAMPLGLALYALASIQALKLGAGLFLATLLGLTLAGGVGRMAIGPRGALVTGVFAGVTGGALAMVGPPIALYMTAINAGKAVSRATILAAFLPCYGVLAGGQMIATGVTQATLLETAGFLPALGLGTLAGHLLSGRVPERRFRQAVTLFLAATSVALIMDGGGLWSLGG
ncbi:MAG: TSUP family transporter [Pseudomonadota bacterium]